MNCISQEICEFIRCWPPTVSSSFVLLCYYHRPNPRFVKCLQTTQEFPSKFPIIILQLFSSRTPTSRMQQWASGCWTDNLFHCCFPRDLHTKVDEKTKVYCRQCSRQMNDMTSHRALKTTKNKFAANYHPLSHYNIFTSSRNWGQ